MLLNYRTTIIQFLLVYAVGIDYLVALRQKLRDLLGAATRAEKLSYLTLAWLQILDNLTDVDLLSPQFSIGQKVRALGIYLLRSFAS